MISQWVGDIAIDTKLSCDQKLGYFTQDPGKHGSFMQDLGGRKTLIFHLKTESSQISLDKIISY